MTILLKVELTLSLKIGDSIVYFLCERLKIFSFQF